MCDFVTQHLSFLENRKRRQLETAPKKHSGANIRGHSSSIAFWKRKPWKARPSSRGCKCKNAESPFARSKRVSPTPFLMAVLTTRSAFVVRSASGYRGGLRFWGGSAAEGAGADVALRQAQLYGAARISLSGGSSLFWPGPAAAGGVAEVQLQHIIEKNMST